jgi:hypothetical protein
VKRTGIPCGNRAYDASSHSPEPGKCTVRIAGCAAIEIVEAPTTAQAGNVKTSQNPLLMVATAPSAVQVMVHGSAPPRGDRSTISPA